LTLAHDALVRLTNALYLIFKLPVVLWQSLDHDICSGRHARAIRTYKKQTLADLKFVLGHTALQHRTRKSNAAIVSLLGQSWSILPIGTNARARHYCPEKPRSRAGCFVRVVEMLETADFFEGQIKQCNSLAARASDKSDREFWLRLAHRWEALLQTKRHGTLNVEVNR
jgi:hypothetical protein